MKTHIYSPRDKKYYQSEKGKVAKARGDRKYRQTKKGKEAMKQQTMRHRQKYPEKYAAKTAVSNALRLGILIKEPCEFCGTTVDVEGHHFDYILRLNVIWLCRNCHKILHREVLA